MPTVIGVFTNRSQAERAVADIRSEGISEERVSIVARHGYIHGDDNDTNDSFVGLVQDQTGDETTTVIPTGEAFDEPDEQKNLSTGTTTGGAVGGITGLLAGAGLMTIPGLGPILALGPIVSGLAGAALGGITGSLVDMGLEKDQGEYYEAEVERGGILAAVECDQTQINNVAAVFRHNGARDVETY